MNPSHRQSCALDGPLRPSVSEPVQNERPYIVRMTPSVHLRLVEYFNGDENAGLRQSDMMEKLLNVYETSISDDNRMPTLNSEITESTQPELEPDSDVSSERSYELDGEESEESDMDYEEEEDEGQGQVYEENEDQRALVTLQRRMNLPSTGRNYYQPTATAPSMNATTSAGSLVQSVDSSAIIRNQFSPIRKGLGTGKQKPWTTQLRRYAYEIIKKWQRDGLLYCRECDRWLRVVHNSCGFRCANAVDHVCSYHYEVPLYACRLCPQRTLTVMQMRKHLKRVHDRTKDFVDLTDTHYTELVERIDRCYKFDGQEGPPSGVRKLFTLRRRRGEICLGAESLEQEMDAAYESSVRRVVYDLVAKWKKENALYCRQCDHWVRVSTATVWSQGQSALGHVCGHYGQPLYVCILCKNSTVTHSQMIIHLRNVHQTSSRGNYVEEIDDHQVELKNLAAACFDWEVGTGPPPIEEDEVFFLKNPRGRPIGSAQFRMGRTITNRAVIMEYGRKLINQYCGKTERKMMCQQCQQVSFVKDIRGGTARPDILMEHALRHLDKDAYFCPYCDESAKRRDTIRNHMFSHTEGTSSDYVDKTGEMKEELMNMMNQCYGLGDWISQRVRRR